MPLAQWVLATIPTVPLGVIVVFISVGLSVLGLVFFRRFVPHHILNSHTELTAALFEAVGMAYTVILAFMVVVSWQNFDRAKGHVQEEANELVDLYRDSAAFPAQVGDRIRSSLKNYYDIVVQEEWALLAKGEESAKAHDALREIWKEYVSYEPQTENQITFFSESVSNLNDLRAARRLRITESRTGINPILWFVLIFGGVVTVAFTFFFAAENFTYNWILVSILAAIISLVLLTILIFDFPFTGDVNIPVSAYQQIVNF